MLVYQGVFSHGDLGDINWFSEDHGLLEYGNPDQEAVEGQRRQRVLGTAQCRCR